MSTPSTPEPVDESKEAKVKSAEAAISTAEVDQDAVVDTEKSRMEVKSSDDGARRLADHGKPEKKVSLDAGTRVEVLQTEPGLEGAWFSGTVLEVKPGQRLVRYDELLSDTDLTTKLSEWVAFDPPASGKRASASSSSSTPSSSSHQRAGGEKQFHGIRPLPPPAPPRSLSVGDYVEVNADDGNWLACILRVEADNTLHVLYPDTMDDSRVSPTQVRVAQQWDEIKDVWSPFRPSDIIRKRVRRRLNRIASQPPPVPSTRLHATTLARRTAAGAWVTPKDPKRLASARLASEGEAVAAGSNTAETVPMRTGSPPAGGTGAGIVGGAVTKDPGPADASAGISPGGVGHIVVAGVVPISGGGLPAGADKQVGGGLGADKQVGGGLEGNAVPMTMTPVGGPTHDMVGVTGGNGSKPEDESARKRMRLRADGGLSGGSGASSGGVSLMLRRLVESGAILLGEEVHYRSKKGEVLLTGVIREGGIECHHCNTVVSLSVFEIHSGSTNHRPSAHTFIPRRGQSLQDVAAPPATPVGSAVLFQTPSPGPRPAEGADSPAGTTIHYATINGALTSVRLDPDGANASSAARGAPRGTVAEVLALQAEIRSLQAELATKNKIIAEHSTTMAEVSALLPMLRRIAEPLQLAAMAAAAPAVNPLVAAPAVNPAFLPPTAAPASFLAAAPPPSLSLAAPSLPVGTTPFAAAPAPVVPPPSMAAMADQAMVPAITLPTSNVPALAAPPPAAVFMHPAAGPLLMASPASMSLAAPQMTALVGTDAPIAAAAEGPVSAAAVSTGMATVTSLAPALSQVGPGGPGMVEAIGTATAQAPVTFAGAPSELGAEAPASSTTDAGRAAQPSMAVVTS